MVDSLPDGKMLQKDVSQTSNPVRSPFPLCYARTDYCLQTETPPIDFTTDMMYLMKGISSLVNVRWYLGN